MLNSLTKKQKFIFFIILGIMILIIFYYIYSTLYTNDLLFSYEDNDLISDDSLIKNSENISNSESFEKDNIVVYVCGAVKESKVVTLDKNSRVCDAIEAVGGLNEDADLININLAYILEDGEKIYIPKKGEENQSDLISQYSTNYSSNNKININKASQTELETIPGIGPSTALKIINYREENGKFSSIEDIKNVPGIGDAKFENMKNYISIK